MRYYIGSKLSSFSSSESLAAPNVGSFCKQRERNSSVNTVDPLKLLNKVHLSVKDSVLLPTFSSKKRDTFGIKNTFNTVSEVSLI